MNPLSYDGTLFCLIFKSIFIANLSRYCPPCQHASLVERLQENLKSFEQLIKKRDADNKRKERLAFVSLSLSNIIPKTGSRKSVESDEKPERKSERKSRKRRDQTDSSSDDSSDSSSGQLPVSCFWFISGFNFDTHRSYFYFQS